MEEARATPPESAETQRLLEQARQGNSRAVDELFARHRPFLRLFVGVRLDPKLRRRLDPSDIVQEAQLEATRRLNTYLERSPMPFRLWLRQIAHDRLLKARRYHLGSARRAVSREVGLPDQSSVLLAQQLVSHDPGPDRQLDREELAGRLQDALARLGEDDREILLLRSVEGLSYQEVSYLLGIAPTASRKRHGRALLRLHKLLFPGGGAEGQS